MKTTIGRLRAAMLATLVVVIGVAGVANPAPAASQAGAHLFTWAVASPMQDARAGHPATLLSNGRVLGGGPDHSSLALPTSSMQVSQVLMLPPTTDQLLLRSVSCSHSAVSSNSSQPNDTDGAATGRYRLTTNLAACGLGSSSGSWWPVARTHGLGLLQNCHEIVGRDQLVRLELLEDARAPGGEGERSH
jgi:hypothetical protein